MHINASQTSDHANRSDLIRQLAGTQRSQRQFGAHVLNRTPQSHSFRSLLDRVSLSVQARAAKQTSSATQTVSPAATPAGEAPTTLPPVTPNTSLSATVDKPTYTKPKPTASTPASVPQPTVPEIVGEDKHGLGKTEDVVGGSSVARGPREVDDAGETTRLPHAVLQEQLFAAFGATSGDDRFNAALDLDGDGTIGLNDLNHLNFRGHERPVPSEVRPEELTGSDEVDRGASGPKPDVTLPPVVVPPPKPDAALIDGKHDLSASETLVGSTDAINRGPRPEPGAAVALPKSVVQEQLFAAFGAIDGDASFNAALDFDGDGMIGLNDLNHLLSQG